MTVITDLWAVLITKPGYDEVRIGPIQYRHSADQMVWGLGASGAARPPYTKIEAVPYDDDHKHLPLLPNDVAALAEMMGSEKGGDGTGSNFPDLYARVVAEHGHDRGATVWHNVTSYLAAEEAQAEEEAEEAERERRAKSRRIIGDEAWDEAFREVRALLQGAGVLNPSGNLVENLVEAVVLQADVLPPLPEVREDACDAMWAAEGGTWRQCGKKPGHPLAEAHADEEREWTDAMPDAMPATCVETVQPAGEPPAHCGLERPCSTHEKV
jgi:hypothetical protein